MAKIMLTTIDKRQFRFIFATAFWCFVAASMSYLLFPPLFLNPSFPLLPADTGAIERAIYLSIALAIYPLGQFIGSPILGSLADSRGHKRILLISLVIAALANLGTAIAITMGQLWLLITNQFIFGFMDGNIAIARAMATEVKSIPKEKSLGLIDAAYCGAYIFGPFIGAWLCKHSIDLPFYAACFIFVFLCLPAALLIKKTPIARTVRSKQSLLKRTKMLFFNRHLKILLLTVTIFTLAVDIYYEFGPVYLTLKWMYDPSQLIWYNAFLCIGLVVGNGWLPGFLCPRFPEKFLLYTSLAGFVLLMIPMAFTDSVLLMLTLFGLIGLVIGVAVTILTVQISNSVSQEIQGEIMGVQQSFRVLGDATICIFGGGLLILSSKVVLILSAAVALTALIYYRLATSAASEKTAN